MHNVHERKQINGRLYKHIIISINERVQASRRRRPSARPSFKPSCVRRRLPSVVCRPSSSVGPSSVGHTATFVSCVCYATNATRRHVGHNSTDDGTDGQRTDGKADGRRGRTEHDDRDDGVTTGKDGQWTDDDGTDDGTDRGQRTTTTGRTHTTGQTDDIYIYIYTNRRPLGRRHVR